MCSHGRKDPRPQNRLTAAVCLAVLVGATGCSYFVGQKGHEGEANRGEQQAEAARQQTGDKESRDKLKVENQQQAVMNEGTREENPLAGLSPDRVRACMGPPVQAFGGGGTGLSQWIYYAGGRANADGFTCKITVSFDADKATDIIFAAPNGQSIPQPPPECQQRIQKCVAAR